MDNKRQKHAKTHTREVYKENVVSSCLRVRSLMAEEAKIEKKLCQEVKKIGGLALKFISTVNGYPDRLILVKFGRLAFVEVKAPGKKPRPLQIRRINELRDMGFKVYVLDNKNQINHIIDEIKGGHSGWNT